MERILAYNVKDMVKLKAAATILKMKVQPIEINDNRIIKDIIAKKSNTGNEFRNEDKKSLLILVDFSSKSVDRLLASIRKNNIYVDYKAMLTETNANWTMSEMLEEMEKERRAYEEKK